MGVTWRRTRVQRSARAPWPLLSAAGGLAGLVMLAGPASASISDGAEDDNSDPVLVVTCDLIPMPDGSLQEVCFEAQKGDPADPPTEPEPTEPEPTEPEPTEPGPAEPEPPAEPAPAEPASEEPVPAGEPTPRRQPVTPGQAPADSSAADSSTVPAAEPALGPTRSTLPNTGPVGILGQSVAGMGLLTAGLLLVRRSRVC